MISVKVFLVHEFRDVNNEFFGSILFHNTQAAMNNKQRTKSKKRINSTFKGVEFKSKMIYSKTMIRVLVFCFMENCEKMARM